MEPPRHLNIQGGSIYPEQANLFDAAQGSRVEGLPFDPSTRPLALLRIVVSNRRESNHDFAQGKCALSVKIHLWAHLVQ